MSKEAIEHYEAALKEAFPSGATGDVFHHWNEARKALAEQPAQDNTYGYAKYLAEAMFKRHFASDEHYASGRVVWGVNDTVIGILTQIDNMVADMVRRPAQQEPVAFYVYKPTLPRGNLGSVSDGDLPWVYDQDPSSGFSARMLVTPITSPPASKPWVGLSAEDREQHRNDWYSNIHDKEFQAIEAKLKEKNT